MAHTGLLEREKCQEPAIYLAVDIWRHLKYSKEHARRIGKPELEGFWNLNMGTETDILLCNSYVCSMAHLLQDKEGWYTPYTPLVVDTEWNIRKDLVFQLAPELEGARLPDDYFTMKICSGGKESIDELWEREKSHFIQ